MSAHPMPITQLGHVDDLAGLLESTTDGNDALARQLVHRAVAEHPVLRELVLRDQLLVAVWLSGHRSARTRRAYAADVAGWLCWLREVGVDVLSATRLHVDLWTRAQLDTGAAAASVTRRISGVSSFYRHTTAHHLTPTNPVDGVRRPHVDPDHSPTRSLDRAQARALLAVADCDPGPQRLRTAAAIRLLLHNALRVDELACADVIDLGHSRGHRILDLTRKGSRRATTPLGPDTTAALEAYLDDRAAGRGVGAWELTGPLLATSTGGRLDQAALWHLVRRLARAAQIPGWNELSPHSLRHTAITLALDAGAGLREVQDYAGHAEPRTTRGYDHSRHNLDSSPTYVLETYLST